jgi:hypothetical protein
MEKMLRRMRNEKRRRKEGNKPDGERRMKRKQREK